MGNGEPRFSDDVNMKQSWKTTRVSMPVVMLLFCAWITSLVFVWKVKHQIDFDDQQVLEQEFHLVVQTTAPAVVAIEADRTGFRNMIQHIGTGFIIAPDGYIITNEHVVSYDEGENIDITVTLADKRKFIAEIVAADPRCDIAVIKIDTEESLPVLPLAPPSQLTRGQVVISLGNSSGDGSDGEAVATYGRINRLNQKPSNELDREHDRLYDNLIMFSATTEPGNSGGPLINTLGQAIGITTAMGASADSNRQFGFAIALDEDTLEIVDQLLAGQTVSHAFLGVTTDDPGYGIRDDMGIKDISGALVDSVPLGAPAQRAGIRSGDLIRAINNVRIYNSLDFTSKINRCKPGDTVTIDLLRGANGKSTKLSFTLELDTRDIADMAGYNEESLLRRRNRYRGIAWGMEVMNLTDWRRQKSNLSTDQPGVLIYDVRPNSAAEQQNVKPGDLLIGLGDNRVNNLRDFNRYARYYNSLPPVKTLSLDDR